jgi:hypothetical protein
MPGIASSGPARPAEAVIGRSPSIARSPSIVRSGLLVAGLVVAVAACGGAATVTPTATPTGSLAAVEASRLPAASPSPDAAALALQRFVAFAKDPKASYQATFTGDSRHSTAILDIGKGLLQVSGPDVRVLATFTYPDRTKSVVEHRLVDDKAWIRVGTGRWFRLGPFDLASSMAAFPEVKDAGDVEVLGPTKVGGKTLYRLRVRSAIVNPVMIPANNLTDTAVTDPELVVLVDAAGKPVSGTATIRGKGRVSGQLQEIVIDLKLTFTKVGQAVRIAAP